MNNNGNGRHIGNGQLDKALENNHRGGLHPAWERFIHFCERLQFGEVERLKIQDGIPMAAEVTTKKVRFAP